MKYLILALPLFFISCGADKLQHQTLFGTEYFGSGDSLIIQIKAENGILTGQSFRKNKNLICDLKGNVEADGGIIYSEYFGGGECYGIFKGKFNELGDGKSAERNFIYGEWQKPDTTVKIGTGKVKLEVKNGYSEVDFAHAITQNQPLESVQSPGALPSGSVPKKKATNLPTQFLEGAKKLYQAAETKIATDKKEKAQKPSPLPPTERPTTQKKKQIGGDRE